jgi:hypothetical protein
MLYSAAKKIAEAKLKEKEAEAKRLAKKAAEEEDARATVTAKKPKAGAPPKKGPTEFERYQLEQKAKKEAEEKAAALKAGLTVADPLNMMKPNVNRERAAKEAEGEFEATGVDAALSVLSVSGVGGVGKEEVDAHPERRMKAAFAAFEDREMAILKEENSSLKRSQMKEQIWKKWQKSPENVSQRYYLLL